ncbi:MAG: alkaline phosphatase family protein, partial [Myxococcota bacterium]
MNRNIQLALATLAFTAFCLTSGCSSEGGPSDGGGSKDAAITECLYQPAAVALEKTRKATDGTGIIPSGRAITPEGTVLRNVGLFPGEMVMTPDGKTLAISGNGRGDNHVVFVDTATWTVKLSDPSPKDRLFYGMAISKTGDRMYVSTGSGGEILVYDMIGKELPYQLQSIPVGDGVPSGMALSADGATLFVAQMIGKQVTAFSTATGKTVATGSVAARPLGVAVSSDQTRVYVSALPSSRDSEPGTVSVFSLPNLDLVKVLTAGKNPGRIIADPIRKRVLVLNNDQETISVIDEATDTITSTVSLLDPADPVLGVFPMNAAHSPDGLTLYVAAAAKNSIEVLDAATLARRGSIPAGWYPDSVAVSPDGKKLYALNAKGEGTGSNADGVDIDDKMTGTALSIDVPSDAALEALTRKVQANNSRPSAFFPAEQCAGSGFPVPFVRGAKSPIEHIIFVLKENRTFDQVFGAFPGVDGDPSLVVFGEDVAPNHHKLAREYTIMDNYFLESEVSSQGHLWATGMEVNDFSERTRFKSGRPDDGFQASGVDYATCPLNPFVFEALYNNKISFVDYGEIVGMGSQSAEIMEFWDKEYPGLVYNLGVSDRERVEYILKRLGRGFLPSFSFVLLPRDHTSGTKAGTETPDSMVADNDEALGMLVEGVSRSKYWQSTLIFVTEDDPQDGADHVDAHRSFGLVISPWARRGYVSGVHHSIGSFFATMGRILNLAPLNTYDQYAAPLFDCLTNKADLKQYEHIPRKVPVKYNNESTIFAAESAAMDFSVPDETEGLQK